MQTSALDRAFATSERMRLSAKAVATSLPAIIPTSTSGIGYTGPTVGNATEQLRHNAGWVFACVRAIAQRGAGQQICVARVGQRGRGQKRLDIPLALKHLSDRLEPLESHRLLDVLNDPNEFQVAWSLIFTTLASLELTGRAFWWLTESPDRELPVIMPLPSSWIDRPIIEHGRYDRWLVRPDGITEPIEIPGERMAYFHYPDPSNPWGSVSPLQALALAVTADESIQGSQEAAFRLGIMPRFVLTAGRLPDSSAGKGQRPSLTPEQRKQLVDAIKGAYAGVLRQHEPMIIDGLIESVSRLSQTPSEMDFLGSSKLTKGRILEGFGVNEIILGATQGANRAQATVAEESFCTNTVNPKLMLMSQVLTQWVAPEFARPGEKLVVWIEPARATDAELKLKEWELGLKYRVVTGNEYRRAVLNLEDQAGLDQPSTAGTRSRAVDR